jgi:hypothetical protein
VSEKIFKYVGVFVNFIIFLLCLFRAINSGLFTNVVGGCRLSLFLMLSCREIRNVTWTTWISVK